MTKSSRHLTSLINARSLLCLILGLLMGFFLAMLFVLSSTHDKHWLRIGGGNAHSSEDSQNDSGPEITVAGRTHFHENNDSLAMQLYSEVRVLCWIMTFPYNHETKAKHVLKTWGKRCNQIIFMSSEPDDSLGAVALPVKDGRNNLWAKTKEAFKYVYQHHYNDADWFLKADDDTYVIVENLRYMLYPYSTNDPIYFGHKFKPFVKQGYMSGGAGYVLSKEALRLFVEKALTNGKLCRQENDGAEDAELGKCMQNVGVIAGDSRDSMGRGRFFPFVPEHHLLPFNNEKMFWYWQYIYYETEEGFDCCSDNSVSFHYVTPKQMYVLEFLIYHLQPYGIVNKQDSLPEKISMADLKTNSSTENIRKVKLSHKRPMVLK